MWKEYMATAWTVYIDPCTCVLHFCIVYTCMLLTCHSMYTVDTQLLPTHLIIE